MRKTFRRENVGKTAAAVSAWIVVDRF